MMNENWHDSQCQISVVKMRAEWMCKLVQHMLLYNE